MRTKATLGVVALSTLAAVLACSSNDTSTDGGAGKPSAGGAASGGTSSTNGGRSGSTSTSGGAPDLVGGANLGGTSSASGAGESATAGAAGNDSAPEGQAGAAGAGGQADCDGSLLILLDRSKSLFGKELSLGVSYWAALQTAFSTVNAALPSPRPWALKLFPDGDNGTECGAVPEEITVPFAPASSNTVTERVLATEALGNGTPLAVAYDAAVKYLQTLPEQPKSIVLITDGVPNCTLEGTAMSDTAQAQALQIAKDAAQAGIRSFVIGIGVDSGQDFKALADLVTAGGTARLSNPVSAEFYQATDQAQLNAALASVAQRVANCESEPIIEAPGYHALPFVTDFEDGSLDDFRLVDDQSFFDPGAPLASIVLDGTNHLLSFPPPAGPALAVAGGHEWTDASLHVKLRFVDSDAQATIRLRFDALASAYVTLDLGPGSFRVRQRGLGSTADLITPSPKPVIVADTWYEVGLSVVGDQVNVSLDGVPIGSATTANASPRGGLALGSLEGGVDFDDLFVTAP